MAKIGEACHDENGGLVNGKKGDQTGKEVVINSYRNEFTVAYRAKDTGKRALLCSAMQQACNNDHIGYSQSDRYSMYQEMIKTGNISLIMNDCNTDCSQLVASCCIIVGIPISPYMCTSDEDSRLMNSGYFTKIINVAENDLKCGDIVWRKGHTAIVVEESEKKEESPSRQPKWVGVVTSALNVRTGPGVLYPKYSAWPMLGEGNMVDVCDEVSGWYYIRIAGVHFAYVNKNYIKPYGVEEEEHPSKKAKWTGRVTTDLNVRTGPGVLNKKYSDYPLLKEGQCVDVCDEENGWYYICIENKHYAWASKKYIVQA